MKNSEKVVQSTIVQFSLVISSLSVPRRIVKMVKLGLLPPYFPFLALPLYWLFWLCLYHRIPVRLSGQETDGREGRREMIKKYSVFPVVLRVIRGFTLMLLSA